LEGCCCLIAKLPKLPRRAASGSRKAGVYGYGGALPSLADGVGYGVEGVEGVAMHRRLHFKHLPDSSAETDPDRRPCDLLPRRG
jgi:hypothetical protein